MYYGDYRDYNEDLRNMRTCDAIDRSRELPPDYYDEDDDENLSDGDVLYHVNLWLRSSASHAELAEPAEHTKPSGLIFP